MIPHDDPRPQRIIGLTGGLGTGKSTVARLLADQRIPLLDADHEARRAVAVGSPVLTQIRERYGPEILDAQGSLQRQRLGQIVFGDVQERQWLEAQIHPFVRLQCLSFLAAQAAAPIVALVVPLLFEAAMTDLVSEIWVVTCSEAQQWQRIQARDPWSEADIQQRLASQWPLALKIAHADRIVDNSGSLKDLSDQVRQALDRPPPLQPT